MKGKEIDFQTNILLRIKKEYGGIFPSINVSTTNALMLLCAGSRARVESICKAKQHDQGSNFLLARPLYVHILHKLSK